MPDVAAARERRADAPAPRVSYITIDPATGIAAGLLAYCGMMVLGGRH